MKITIKLIPAIVVAALALATVNVEARHENEKKKSSNQGRTPVSKTPRKPPSSKPPIGKKEIPSASVSSVSPQRVSMEAGQNGRVLIRGKGLDRGVTVSVLKGSARTGEIKVSSRGSSTQRTLTLTPAKSAGGNYTLAVTAGGKTTRVPVTVKGRSTAGKVPGKQMPISVKRPSDPKRPSTPGTVPDRGGAMKVDSITPKLLVLGAGQKGNVLLKGTGLEQVERYSLVKGSGGRTRDLTATLKKTKGEARFSVAATKAASGDYQLMVMVGREVVRVPVTVKGTAMSAGPRPGTRPAPPKTPLPGGSGLVKIASISPKLLSLKPGESGTVTLEGSGLDSLTRFLIVRGNSKSTDVSVEPARKSTGEQLQLSLTAGRSASGSYDLMMIVNGRMMRTPISVAGKGEPVPLPSPGRGTPGKPPGGVATTIGSMSPEEVRLKAGGESAQFTINGSNLASVRNIGVVRNGRPVRGFSIQQDRITELDRKVIKVAAESGTRSGIYELILKNGRHAISARIIVGGIPVPEITGFDAEETGYVIRGSNFGSDKGVFRVFENDTEVGTPLISKVTPTWARVRSMPEGTTIFKVAVLGLKSEPKAVNLTYLEPERSEGDDSITPEIEEIRLVRAQSSGTVCGYKLVGRNFISPLSIFENGAPVDNSRVTLSYVLNTNIGIVHVAGALEGEVAHRLEIDSYYGTGATRTFDHPGPALNVPTAEPILDFVTPTNNMVLNNSGYPPGTGYIVEGRGFGDNINLIDVFENGQLVPPNNVTLTSDIKLEIHPLPEGLTEHRIAIYGRDVPFSGGGTVRNYTYAPIVEQPTETPEEDEPSLPTIANVLVRSDHYLVGGDFLENTVENIRVFENDEEVPGTAISMENSYLLRVNSTPNGTVLIKVAAGETESAPFPTEMTFEENPVPETVPTIVSVLARSDHYLIGGSRFGDAVENIRVFENDEQVQPSSILLENSGFLRVNSTPGGTVLIKIAVGQDVSAPFSVAMQFAEQTPPRIDHVNVGDDYYDILGAHFGDVAEDIQISETGIDLPASAISMAADNFIRVHSTPVGAVEIQVTVGSLASAPFVTGMHAVVENQNPNIAGIAARIDSYEIIGERFGEDPDSIEILEDGVALPTAAIGSVSDTSIIVQSILKPGNSDFVVVVEGRDSQPYRVSGATQPVIEEVRILRTASSNLACGYEIVGALGRSFSQSPEVYEDNQRVDDSHIEFVQEGGGESYRSRIRVFGALAGQVEHRVMVNNGVGTVFTLEHPGPAREAPAGAASLQYILGTADRLPDNSFPPDAGYEVRGSGFGSDPAMIDVYENGELVASEKVTLVSGDAIRVVPATLIGAIEYRVAVAGRVADSPSSGNGIMTSNWGSGPAEPELSITGIVPLIHGFEIHGTFPNTNEDNVLVQEVIQSRLLPVVSATESVITIGRFTRTGTDYYRVYIGDDTETYSFNWGSIELPTNAEITEANQLPGANHYELLGNFPGLTRENVKVYCNSALVSDSAILAASESRVEIQENPNLLLFQKDTTIENDEIRSNTVRHHIIRAPDITGVFLKDSGYQLILNRVTRVGDEDLALTVFENGIEVPETDLRDHPDLLLVERMPAGEVEHRVDAPGQTGKTFTFSHPPGMEITGIEAVDGGFFVVGSGFGPGDGLTMYIDDRFINLMNRPQEWFEEDGRFFVGSGAVFGGAGAYLDDQNHTFKVSRFYKDNEGNHLGLRSSNEFRTTVQLNEESGN